ncbi:MAG: YihY/virulence factor BrkB family protein, partial [Lachnospiraceae bacterium]|nr:YihY/virulence factor BrkB family protein [Lachnospiraceae bacterium]
LGLNQIYQVDQKRHFLVRRLLAVGYTLAFIVIVLLCLILLVFGNRLQILLTHTFPLLGQITAFIINLRSFLSIAILTLFFSLLYKVLPNRPLSYKKQLPGAVFAALGWVLFSFFYSIYIDNFSNYAHIYGSMTALILLCLWIYVCMNIVLIGAQINMWLSERE